MSLIDVKVPDIGDFKNVPVIEIMVRTGDAVRRDDPLVTLESDKAAIEVPSPEAGIVTAITVKIGDKVSEGSPIIQIDTAAGEKPAASAVQTSGASATMLNKATAAVGAAPAAEDASLAPAGSNGTSLPPAADFSGVFASPSVRMIARELGIDLTKIKGSGDNGRVTKDDVKRALSSGNDGGGTAIPEIPSQDFAKFGPVESVALSRLKRLSGPHLHRAWLNVPHVTHADEADITELEEYRKGLDAAARDKGYRVTLLPFAMKAAVVALKEHPVFNASLAPGKQNLVLKRYYSIGVAVDTPDGLVVPVIKDVDRKGIIELSQELGAVSQRMRDGRISPPDIQGGTFSISSLGGIGGTSFTPIINAPEVAILGLVRAAVMPKWINGAFAPRLILPLCLSYDHRVIDGAQAARFTARLASILADVRQLVL